MQSGPSGTGIQLPAYCLTYTLFILFVLIYLRFNILWTKRCQHVLQASLNGM